jgi:hypothetical protein
MRLGLGEPLHGVGWGVGPSSSVVSSCNAVSAILPIPPEISGRTPILAARPRAIYAHWWAKADDGSSPERGTSL